MGRGSSSPFLPGGKRGEVNVWVWLVDQTRLAIAVKCHSACHAPVDPLDVERPPVQVNGALGSGLPQQGLDANLLPAAGFSLFPLVDPAGRGAGGIHEQEEEGGAEEEQGREGRRHGQGWLIASTWRSVVSVCC